MGTTLSNTVKHLLKGQVSRYVGTTLSNTVKHLLKGQVSRYVATTLSNKVKQLISNPLFWQLKCVHRSTSLKEGNILFTFICVRHMVNNHSDRQETPSVTSTWATLFN